MDRIVKNAEEASAQILVVSKNRENHKIQKLYDYGFRHMGENRVQSLMDKKDELPSDIKWHIIGHLQKNKVKYIAEFIELIHSVDSINLAKTINKEAKKHRRVIPILLQCKVAIEATKFGIAPNEIGQFVDELQKLKLENISIHGMMGMATFTSNPDIVRSEFKQLKAMFDTIKNDYFKDDHDFNILSMGMSGDYELALEEGSNLLRLGSIFFR
ncbi:YggS family pyridoxal phosphate-dependent enzyme [Saprospiraceae bacterium]|nr:YggS family pyridoxal phosphate-dependent enzyme [Saprospiraceae bacterium]